MLKKGFIEKAERMIAIESRIEIVNTMTDFDKLTFADEYINTI